MLRGRQSGPDASNRGGGTTIGTVCKTNPLWVEVDGREVGPLNASSGAAGVIEGDRVLISRHENDADQLTIVGILGRTPTAQAPSSGEGGNVFVQPTNPGLTTPGMWIQTGLGASGQDLAIWVETGG